MKTKSRILAALIAFIMIVGMLPISAFAEGEATPPAGEAPVQTQGDPTEEQPSPTSYTLTLKAEPDGGGTVEGGGSYGAGTEVTVTATASDGYVFTAWYEDAEERGDEDKRSEDAEYTFTLNGDLTLCAVFTQQPQADEQTPATPTDGEPGENTDDESGDTGDGATGGKQEAPAAPTFTVTFDANGHGEAPKAASVTEGETVEKPDDPAEEGFSFNGWYRDKEATDPWDFDTDTVSGDIRLYASWTEAEPESKSETEPELTYPAFDQSKTDNSVTVHVSASEGVFPEGAELTVDAVPNTQVETAVAAQRDDSVNVAVSYTFDIKVMKDGQECQPGENQTVTVSFAMAQASDQNLDATIYHIEDDIADALDTTAAGDEVSAETDGFSIYTVEFTYNNMEYVLPGNTSVSMSEILTAVGLTGEVTAAEVSDASLFSASDATGEWIVTAHQAFSTTEWMKVTISGVVYEITVTDDSAPWAGSGTEAAPWRITSAADLVALRDYVAANGGATQGKHFLQTEDISLSSVCGASIGDFMIGVWDGNSYDYHAFDGTYDGGGHAITGLYIGNGGDGAGLFAEVEVHGTVKNLNVTGYVKGGSSVGGIVGRMPSEASVENCHFTGTVTGTGDRVGGIAGNLSPGSSIVDCTVNGDVSGAEIVGGIAGAANGNSSTKSSIVNCTVDGDISGTKEVGGIAGFLNGDANNCNFTGTVTGTEEVGGIAGHVNSNASSSIIDCTVDGSISGTGRGVGGIAGFNGGTDVSIIDCRAEGKISGASAVGGIFGAAAGTIKNCTFKSGTVTGADQIGGIAGNGNAKLIENCKNYGDISSTTQRAGGIAGESCGPIKNCENHGSVSAQNFAGGITGHSWAALGYQGTVENCKNYGSVTVDNENVGGIVGWAEYPITDCENHGRIQGSEYVGGIAGDTKSTVEKCKNYGTVTGKKNVGPIVGRLGGSAMTLNPNGGNGEEFITVTSPTDRTAPACPFTHNDYSFFAWCTAADGAGTWYFEGDSMPAGELTLYAIWMNSRTEAYRTLSGEWNNTRMAELRDGLYNLPGGWYVATGNITLSERLTFTGDANLVLSDDFTLNASQGIHIAPGSSLTIWGQGGYAGRKVGVLNATGPADCAGIGGNKNQSTGTITINGGVVNATGGDYGAGIGGGDTGSGGIVVINGGTVTATGKEGAAGIGGGDYGNGGSVTVSGGSVTAYGSVRSKTGQGAAGIGAGRPNTDGSQSLNGGSVTVSGGRVFAAAGANDANAIGANTMYSTPGSLTIGDGMQAQPPLVGAEPVHRDKRVDTCRGASVLLDACENHLFDQWRCRTCNLPMYVQDIFDGRGTESEPLLIQSTEDWNMLASLYNEGRLSYSGYWFRLTNDISVTTMLGAEGHPFNARFDGDGHTLSFSAENTNGSQCVAPFAYVSGVTIRNLRTAGSITGTADRASGLIGEVDKPSVIQNCRVSMSVSGGDCVGGFCIGDGGGLTLTGCVFDGSLSTGSRSAGFVGRTDGNGHLTIRDCLFEPASVSNNINTFYYDDTGTHPVTVTNSYCLTTYGTTQGKQAFSVTADESVTIDFGTPIATYPASGITAYSTGLVYENTFYAGSGAEISLTLNHDEAPEGMRFIGYDVSAGTLTGYENPYTLTMPEGNVTLTAKYEDIPVTVATVTYKVVGGTWSDGSTGDKTEDVPIPGKPSEVPTGMKPAEGFEGGAWDVDPATATITGDTTFTYTFTAKQPPTPVTKHTVTYVVLNGTWADGSKTNKTEEVEDGKSPTQIPSGMIAAENYEGGAWSPDPNGATITGDTTFTYTFDVKNLDVVGIVNWDGDDNQQDKRPEKIMVRLLANNTEHASQEVKAGPSGLWSFSFDNLPAANAQGTIDYTITVDEIPEYTTKVEKVSGTQFVITNTLNGTVKPTHTVTYNVVNGTWADGTTTPKTEEVEDGQSPTQIPMGMIASEGFEGGSWNPNPTGATITDTASFTYTFTAKQNPPQPITKHTVTYNVVNGTWADGTTTPKTEEVEDGQSPTQIPTGMIASEGFEGGSWSPNPNSATITDTASFTYTFKAKQNPPTPVTKHTVTYIVVNGTWADGTTTPKTEEVEDGQSPTQIPTGMKPAENYEGGSWNPNPSGATITDTASFTYTFKAKQNPPTPVTKHTVTYIVVNGTWADGSTTPKTEEVEDGQSPTQIPTGMIASEGFEGGAWSSDPTSATITDTASFTYTFKAKQNPPTPVTKHTVTYIVVNGTWADGSTTPKTEEVEDGQSPAQIPTGMLPAENYEGGSWNPNPIGATISDTASFTYTFTAKQNPPTPVTKHTVTYIVVNGTWSDGTNGPKTEEVKDGQNPSQIPTGMIASEGFEGGSWSPNPSSATITGAASFTYTFTAKQSPQPTISYTAKDGSGNTVQSVTWQKGSRKNLDLTFKRSEDDHLTYGLFGSLEIGGVTVGSANYSAAEGSLKLSIKPEYLETLSVGDHTVKVNFQDGSATVKLTVLAASAQPTPSPTPKPSEKPTSPKTGDESNLALWLTMMIASLIAMVLVLLVSVKRNRRGAADKQ